jgi:hypothetical protein
MKRLCMRAARDYRGCSNWSGEFGHGGTSVLCWLSASSHGVGSQRVPLPEPFRPVSSEPDDTARPPKRASVKPLPALLILMLTCASMGYAIYWLIRSARF